jgi:hypothetical protein
MINDKGRGRSEKQNRVVKAYKGFCIVLACCFTLFLSTAEGYSYTIDASAGAGGSIWPFGLISVSDGGAQTFTITPQAGYFISDVITDSGSRIRWAILFY